MGEQRATEWRVAFMQNRMHHAFFGNELDARRFATSLEKTLFVVAPAKIEHWNGREWVVVH